MIFLWWREKHIGVPFVIFVILCVFYFFPIQKVYGVTWFISDEQSARAGIGDVAAQEIQAQQIVDTQNDAWLSALSGWILYQHSFWSWTDQSLWWIPYQINNWWDIAELLRVQMDGLVLWTPNPTTTQPKLDNASTLQDSAPYPYSLTWTRMWSETAWWSSSARNALRVDILTWVMWFWAWFGDLETRTDGEWVWAEIQLFSSGTMIASTIISPTTWDQSWCGWDGSSASPSACGNKTTRRIWFLLDSLESVDSVLVIVWDDDDAQDGWTDDGNTEHLSMIGPSFVLGCYDIDEDGVCDTDDVCPLDMFKYRNIWCGCGVEDPEEYGDTCASEKNSCGAYGTWTIQCDGSCDAPVLSLPERYDTVCESDSNVCGDVWTWKVDCDGTCYAFVPELPNWRGELCLSEENSCGDVTTGTIQCDGTCNASIPDETSCDTQDTTELRHRGSWWARTRIWNPYCGDGHLDRWEECDDGNNNADDTCSSCMIVVVDEAVPDIFPKKSQITLSNNYIITTLDNVLLDEDISMEWEDFPITWDVSQAKHFSLPEPVILDVYYGDELSLPTWLPETWSERVITIIKQKLVRYLKILIVTVWKRLVFGVW